MKAVFFDMDGTLIDSKADLAAAVNHTRRTLGLAEMSLDEVTVNIGNGARHLLETSIPECAGGFEELWPIYLKNYESHMCDQTRLFPGVAETLAALKSAGWLLGINTNKPAFATKAILQHFGIDGYFGEAILAGGDLPEMKPSALPLIVCAERLHHTLTPDDWMVGDHWTDLASAANAGIKSVFCTFGIGETREYVPTARIDHFADLVSLLGRGQ